MENNTTMTSIELDVVEGPDGIDLTCLNLTYLLDVAYFVNTMNGPGGGHPVVTFTGPRDHLIIMLVMYCDGDREHLLDILKVM